jgi:hypothetical protein
VGDRGFATVAYINSGGDPEVERGMLRMTAIFHKVLFSFE